ncbi:c-type cytochrome biogenesis protein CcmI [Fulvimarina sp. 2208YS6-2-32]|uniref:C-type cytochrome biogenesis protein CcmI n=1 Tax=Fulvimarina uroteuthidis TaxID=3098149 RepID=A0ABU5I192_9HYPH|nr:c-type cytochrome biogenesis protein CcmI [Fulvimarina sp. 2208YS6-2-32]MDY8109144.1 c-type cytochrome biogenesis protein CcmI [Fulvimarina sp. 2208YS6-2-32]
MVFWFIIAAMTLGVVLLLVYPVFSSSIGSAEGRAAHDVEVYRSQLREVEGDVERGTLSPAEAETARAEIGRRLLKANDAAVGGASGKAPAGTRRNLVAGVAIILLIPAISVSAYQSFGAFGLPDLPLSARSQPVPDDGSGVPSDILRLVAGAEERLKSDPNDGQGWNVLAPIYLRMGRSEDAIEAFRNATRLLGESVDREAGLGEALTQDAGGEVTDEARGHFESALEANPDYLPARFFVALDLSQEGENADAAAAWAALIENSPANAPWMPIATAALADARGKAGLAPLDEAAMPQPATSATGQAPAQTPRGGPAASAGQGGGAPGPDEDQLAAASQLNPGQRRDMIEGMVSRLASRLEADPNDAQGWQRLIQSYSVLGMDEEAAAALARALDTFSDDTETRAQIAALGNTLGIAGTEGGTQ